MKIVETNVMNSELSATPSSAHYHLWVECPERYDADDITADDIAHDAMITVVDEPEPELGALDYLWAVKPGD